MCITVEDVNCTCWICHSVTNSFALSAQVLYPNTTVSCIYYHSQWFYIIAVFANASTSMMDICYLHCEYFSLHHSNSWKQHRPRCYFHQGHTTPCSFTNPRRWFDWLKAQLTSDTIRSIWNKRSQVN